MIVEVFLVMRFRSIAASQLAGLLEDDSVRSQLQAEAKQQQSARMQELLYYHRSIAQPKTYRIVLYPFGPSTVASSCADFGRR